MKALILAAGIGSRLAPITDKLPKALALVNKKPIILKQIENLTENGVNDITVISGYKAELLERIIHKSFPKVKFIESVEYATTNNMYSAYLGRTAVEGDAFLMMNADVFFDASVIETLLKFNAPDAIVVDIGKYNEESMKVVEENGKLVKISKKIAPQRAFGVSIDIYKFSIDSGKKFFERCAEYIDRNDLKKWSEVALNDILPDCCFKACPLKGRWFEIDNLEDLTAAQELFGETESVKDA